MLIYSFFFPTNYSCTQLTEMPKRGERRILINHDVRISLLQDSSIDFWFMRNEELNAIHSRVKQGSSFEVIFKNNIIKNFKNKEYIFYFSFIFLLLLQKQVIYQMCGVVYFVLNQQLLYLLENLLIVKH